MGGSACIVGSAAISALRAPMHTKLICEKEEKRGWVGSFRIESRGLAAVSKKKKEFSATQTLLPSKSGTAGRATSSPRATLA